MSSQPHKSSKPIKHQNRSQTPSRSSSSTICSHLVMVELKQRILTSLSKLSDRDTQQVAVDDLENIIHSLSPEAIPMLLNCLYDASSDPKPAVKKESLRLLTLVCAYHGDFTSTHLTKIIAHIVKRLKDSDSSVRDACRDTIGALSAQYLKADNGGGDNGGLGPVVALFVKPLFEAMGEQNKLVQSGAATCMAKMVECASDPPTMAFQKLCPRICKLLCNPNFLSNAALLPVVTNLSQVGAIAPQSFDHLLHSVHDCLGCADWATRKAAADTLCALASHSSNLITDGGASTLTILEACRCDKIKPVRDSMTEALQLWKKVAGKTDNGITDAQKPLSHGESLEENNSKWTGGERGSEPPEDSAISDSVFSTRGGRMLDKAVIFLKRRAPSLTDKELNPEFFQKLETIVSDDLPVEVIVPRKCVNSSNSNNEEGSDLRDKDERGRSNRSGNIQSNEFHGTFNSKYRIDRGSTSLHSRQRDYNDHAENKGHEEKANGKDTNQRESSGNNMAFSKTNGQSEGPSLNNKGSWVAIQRQLLQLERQQAHLMNMLQDYIGGSHDSMVTLENRVRGLERVVEDMARDLSVSSGSRFSNFPIGFEGTSNRPLGKYNGFSDYSSVKFGRGNEGRIPFGERFSQSDGISSGIRGRGLPWRSEKSEVFDFPPYGASRNGQISSKRTGGGSTASRSPKSEHEIDQGGSRRAWDKGGGPIRLGEGPSARSVWQASKDEATLEAIRVAGEDSGTSRTARVAVPELSTETLGDDNAALQVGDLDSAYAEVLATGDDFLLVKLMDRSGPVVGQLSPEVAAEVFHAVGQFLLDHNLFDICLSWIQPLIEQVLENGSDFLSIPMEVKKEVLLNLHEASSTMSAPEDWEGAPPDQLLSQLARAWEIELR